MPPKRASQEIETAEQSERKLRDSFQFRFKTFLFHPSLDWNDKNSREAFKKLLDEYGKAFPGDKHIKDMTDYYEIAMSQIVEAQNTGKPLNRQDQSGFRNILDGAVDLSTGKRRRITGPESIGAKSLLQLTGPESSGAKSVLQLTAPELPADEETVSDAPKRGPGRPRMTAEEKAKRKVKRIVDKQRKDDVDVSRRISQAAKKANARLAAKAVEVEIAQAAAKNLQAEIAQKAKSNAQMAALAAKAVQKGKGDEAKLQALIRSDRIATEDVFEDTVKLAGEEVTRAAEEAVILSKAELTAVEARIQKLKEAATTEDMDAVVEETVRAATMNVEKEGKQAKKRRTSQRDLATGPSKRRGVMVEDIDTEDEEMETEEKAPSTPAEERGPIPPPPSAVPPPPSAVPPPPQTAPPSQTVPPREEQTSPPPSRMGDAMKTEESEQPSPTSPAQVYVTDSQGRPVQAEKSRAVDVAEGETPDDGHMQTPAQQGGETEMDGADGRDDLLDPDEAKTLLRDDFRWVQGDTRYASRESRGKIGYGSRADVQAVEPFGIHVNKLPEESNGESVFKQSDERFEPFRGLHEIVRQEVREGMKPPAQSDEIVTAAQKPFAKVAGEIIWIPFYERVTRFYFTSEDYRELVSNVVESGGELKLKAPPKDAISKMQGTIDSVRQALSAYGLKKMRLVHDGMHTRFGEWLELKQIMKAISKYQKTTTGEYNQAGLFSGNLREAVGRAIDEAVGKIGEKRKRQLGRGLEGSKRTKTSKESEDGPAAFQAYNPFQQRDAPLQRVHATLPRFI